MHSDDKKHTNEKRLVPGLRCFVKAVKNNLYSRVKKEALCPGTIENAKVLEKQFSSWGSENPHSHNCVDTGNHLYMDYLMHHRVALAAEIVKSMANGRQLSKSSEKVLKSSIEYIEQRL